MALAQVQDGGLTHEDTRKWKSLQELQAPPPPLRICHARPKQATATDGRVHKPRRSHRPLSRLTSAVHNMGEGASYMRLIGFGPSR